MPRPPEIDDMHATRDKPLVFAWLRSYLRWHLDAWSQAYGLHWTAVDIDRHIDGRGLVAQEWNELVSAHGDERHFVGVARDSRRAIGIVHAHERVDRYLAVPIGVLSWLFVEPLSRGSGVSTLLLDAAGQWMAGRGLPAAEVFVTADNTAAVSAYRKGGYQLVDHRLIARIGPASSRRVSEPAPASPTRSQLAEVGQLGRDVSPGPGAGNLDDSESDDASWNDDDMGESTL